MQPYCPNMSGFWGLFLLRAKVLKIEETWCCCNGIQFISKLQEYCGKDNIYVDTSREQFYQLVLWLNIHKVDVPIIKDFVDTWLPMNVNYTLNGKTEIEESLKIGFLTKVEKANIISVESYQEDASLVLCVDDDDNLLLSDDGDIYIFE